MGVVGVVGVVGVEQVGEGLEVCIVCLKHHNCCTVFHTSFSSECARYILRRSRVHVMARILSSSSLDCIHGSRCWVGDCRAFCNITL